MTMQLLELVYHAETIASHYSNVAYLVKGLLAAIREIAEMTTVTESAIKQLLKILEDISSEAEDTDIPTNIFDYEAAKMIRDDINWFREVDMSEQDAIKERVATLSY